MIEVFTPKRIPLIVPSKAARDQQNVQLWLGSVQFEARDQQNVQLWLGSVQFDSAVCCTPQSLTLWWDGMHIEELDFGYDAHPRVFLNLGHYTLRCDAHRGA